MNVSCLFIMLLCMLDIVAHATGPYRTEIMNKEIKTLQVGVANKKNVGPVIGLNSTDVIEINFDALHHASGWFAYKITHCNADWTPSSLSAAEYMKGFQNPSIDDFANSLNTNVSYTNYRLFLPNEDVQFKVSGNYVVSVYNENTPGKIAFTACFSVVDSKVKIIGLVNNNTRSNFNDTCQQLSFVVKHPEYDIKSPKTDLKAFVYQNGHRSITSDSIVPHSVRQGEIVFQNNPGLTFKAGNEYRKMEFLDNQGNGIHIKRTQYKRPYYYIELMTDYIRRNSPYIYDQDRNGRFVIRSSEVEDADTEACYSYVHFCLKSDSIEGGKVYLDGQLFNNTLNSQNEMIYNPENNTYEKTVLLKQGTYNYQYLIVNDENTDNAQTIEGNFAETENEYLIMIYHRPAEIQYDKLIGVKTISSAKKE